MSDTASARSQDIAIVGGGPAGLILARLLQIRGAKVRVYERDIGRHTRVQGATLNINAGTGLEAMRRAGLMDAFRRAYRPGAENLSLADPQARVTFRDPGAANAARDRPEIDRGPLRDLLLDALAPDTVVWDGQVTSLDFSGSVVHLNFKNRPPAQAHLVIGADGASSRVRPYITPIRPRYSGVTVVEGTVHRVSETMPELLHLLDGGKVCALGDSKTIFLVLKGDDSVAYYTGHRSDELWHQKSGIDFGDSRQVLSWFLREFGGWSDIWADLIRKSTPPFVPRPQFCAPPEQRWEALSNLTLIGDAAHVMPPYAGEGVNMAMFDALELSCALMDGRFTDTRAAITFYEQTMRARNASTAAETLQFTDIFHSAGAMDYFCKFFAGAGGSPATDTTATF